MAQVADVVGIEPNADERLLGSDRIGEPPVRRFRRQPQEMRTRAVGLDRDRAVDAFGFGFRRSRQRVVARRGVACGELLSNAPSNVYFGCIAILPTAFRALCRAFTRKQSRFSRPCELPPRFLPASAASYGAREWNYW
jgi:hypothetical protein